VPRRTRQATHRAWAHAAGIRATRSACARRRWSAFEAGGRQYPAGSFVVYCDKPIPETTQAGVARCIEQYKPVHTTYRLRVKAPKKPKEDTS